MDSYLMHILMRCTLQRELGADGELCFQNIADFIPQIRCFPQDRHITDHIETVFGSRQCNTNPILKR